MDYKGMIVDWPVEKWETLRDNFADISCWFMGFEAAKGKDDDYRRPPGLRELETTINELNNKILDHIK